MKVVYRKPIDEILKQAYFESKKDGKFIDKFILTHSEHQELKDAYPYLGVINESEKGKMAFMGIEIEVQ